MPKASAKSKRTVSDSDSSDSGSDNVKPVKKSRPSETKDSCEVVNGEPTWKIGTQRFVKIRKFKSKTFVDIREYWTDDKGEQKPGKKGLCMNLEQWDMLTQIIPEVNQRL
ncbi:activated RNA polymerase II transcriptional coactivator p15-like [Pollicipes pollicipes]|uniref:activated RNA polymerase II transcriptional coactivator p15-like n=1 Tax=Pollicipes pollicipes TaxID=41117 RepID=UPI0018858CFB|nr:activated RNA polymerase II transcriptional coactivator p15-like [Pollicipes pollicipes]XP_037080391.1 activated RNA polymerase II transcriptional coactivator p15-like [Pollicipes pollicipes]